MPPYKNILVFGAPGSGKGTYSSMLRHEYSLEHFSMGDYLRQVIQTGDQLLLSEEDKERVRKGRLLSSQVIERIFQQGLSEKKGDRLIDGYPRSVSQYRRMTEQVHLVINV